MPVVMEENVASRFIRKIGVEYTGAIHVTMRSGITYVYDVPSLDYWYNFVRALSKGRYYNSVIKRRFDYVRKYRK